MSNGRKDLIVSHAGSDRAWAEWVAWHLTEAGYQVELDVWDWATGQGFITKIRNALNRGDRVLSLWSSEYLSPSRYAPQEWSGDIHLTGAETQRLIQLRTERVLSGQMPGILRPLVYQNLFGLSESEACGVLLEAARGLSQPGQEPAFVGRGTSGQLSRVGAIGPRLPGTLPRVWHVPPRNPLFTGRDMLLVTLRERLLSGHRAVVQALQGMGGIGKTQLAIEYAHRFANWYDIVWWIPAEQAGLIMNQVAALAGPLACADAKAAMNTIADDVLAELRTRGRWLLVFDGADMTQDLAPWLPGGSSGHVLITTRTSGWHDIAETPPIELDVFARPESVAILCKRVSRLSETDADSVAEELGDLPLAIAQAASYMADSAIPAEEYIELVKAQPDRVFEQGQSPSYPHTLAAAVQLTLQRLIRENPAAATVAEISAFLAPRPIPLAIFTSAADQLPEQLRSSAADTVDWRRLLTLLGRSALVRVDRDSLQMHRLTQAVLRDQLIRVASERAAMTRQQAATILIANDPGDPDNPISWPAWAQLLPHILAVGSSAISDTSFRNLACNANWYLLTRGDAHGGHDLAKNLHEQWLSQLGSDDPHTLWAASNLAEALRQRGQSAEALQLDEDTLKRRRKVLGKDHPDTLTSATNLAADLRALEEYQSARDLDEDTLTIRRRVLGKDHPSTMMSASKLAADLRKLGDFEAARKLDEDTLTNRRRVLGEDHRDTLISAVCLATDLRKLGDFQAAHDLSQDTLMWERRVLGEDHPSTLISAISLAADLRKLGEFEAARDLDEDTLARRRRLLGEDHPSTMISASTLAADLRALGDFEAARVLDEHTLARRRRVLGVDHPSTLIAATCLADDLTELGEHEAARDLNQDILARRRVFGENDPYTLSSADNLAANLRRLGEYQAARELDEDTLARRRRVLGEIHPDTLTSANNLATDLRALGDHRTARKLDQDTLGRRRQVLGEDNPSTLISAGNLADDLRGLGEYQAARDLDEDTLTRQQRVLGADHPSTLATANSLVANLSALGEHDAARKLDEETEALRRRRRKDNPKR